MGGDPGTAASRPLHTVDRLPHPDLEGGEVNRPTVDEQPWIEVRGEGGLGARAEDGWGETPNLTRPGLGTLTPTPTSLTLGHPALEGGELNRPTVGEQPWIEV